MHFCVLVHVSEWPSHLDKVHLRWEIEASRPPGGDPRHRNGTPIGGSSLSVTSVPPTKRGLPHSVCRVPRGMTGCSPSDGFSAAIRNLSLKKTLKASKAMYQAAPNACQAYNHQVSVLAPHCLAPRR